MHILYIMNVMCIFFGQEKCSFWQIGSRTAVQHEEDERLDNLSLFLSHQYTEWIRLYGLCESGRKLYDTLESEELYSLIWNKDTPLKVEEACEENLKVFIEENHQAESKEIKIVRRNVRPLEYEAFVELMHKHRLCLEVWYEGYRVFVEEQEKWIDNILERNKEKRSAKKSCLP